MSNPLTRLNTILDRTAYTTMYLKRVTTAIQKVNDDEIEFPASIGPRQDHILNRRNTVTSRLNDIFFYSINGIVVYASSDYIDGKYSPLSYHVFAPICLIIYAWIVYRILDRR